jgi:hypothetical protein
LSRLVLSCCCMEITVAHEMAAWFRQPRESSLRELCLVGEYCFYDESVAAITSILTPLDGSRQEISAGASLRVLDLDIRLVQDIQLLVEALASKRSQLRTLSLRDLNPATSVQLARYLPDMMSLRDLNVKWGWRDCNVPTLLDALRQNGSLQTVSIGSVYSDGLLCAADSELLRIQSYCDRNRWATGLLQKLGMALDEDGLMRSEDATLLSLCPSLLHVVKPARRMAPSVLLCGLFACSEAIGPHGDAKRMAS